MQEKRQAGIARGDAKRAIPWVFAWNRIIPEWQRAVNRFFQGLPVFVLYLPVSNVPPLWKSYML
jgi:hypothetical protein